MTRELVWNYHWSSWHEEVLWAAGKTWTWRIYLSEIKTPKIREVVPEDILDEWANHDHWKVAVGLVDIGEHQENLFLPRGLRRVFFAATAGTGHARKILQMLEDADLPADWQGDAIELVAELEAGARR